MKHGKKFYKGLLLAAMAQGSVAYANGLNVNQTGTLVELCASAQQEVAQDAANVNVSFKVEHKDKRVAADEVNKTMSALVTQIKSAYPNVKITNQNYNTYQQYTPKGQAKDWTVEQSFVLESKNPKEVPSLVSMVQEAGVVVNGMNAFLTPQAARAAQEKLYKTAFDDVNGRLGLLANAMGKPSAWQIVHIDTTGQRGCGGGMPMPMMASAKMLGAAASAVEVAPPAFEAGKEMVSLSMWVAAKLK
ncbi:MAG: SIMPL domain-containing protein [Formosimonas sp.]